jgi:ABC-type lipoprotein export system ATPase subunit
MIRLSQITKSYPDGTDRRNIVLKGLDMEVAKGEFTAITGVSGSGKTTLLSILGLLLPPDEGCYFFNGYEMYAKRIDGPGVRNHQMGFVFQEPRLLPQLTVLDNILLPTLAVRKQASAEQAAYARSLMELTGIAGLATKYPATLSGGESSRASLCRALVMKPHLLLADEPTGQLDTATAQGIVNLLLEVNKELGTTVLVVTHSEGVASAARRVLTLANGTLQ